jgi:para-aminobenzoate synthetase component 1
MQLHSAILAGWVQPADLFVQFFAHETNAFWLDRENNPDDAFSVIGSGMPARQFDPQQAAFLARTMSAEDAVDLPFVWRPGLVGFISYEGSASFLEVDRGIVFDHKSQQMYFVGQFETKQDFDFWHHGALLRLGLSGGQVATYLHQSPVAAVTSEARVRHQASEYLGMIASAQERIADGDIYQICLTNEITVTTEADPLVVYLKLREVNPAPYSAFVRIGDQTVASSSPEQFIKVYKSGEISTKPIKGTRPRGSSEVEDLAIAQELQADAKERAENLMIVDLMRNDIGRVARVGTVSVPKLFEIETYATVHQLVSTVTGTLADDQSSWSAVQAAFPGGSMTGAPKISAMEIISELEDGPRGLYSGCIGYFGADGSADFGMTIRSIVFEAGVAKIGVGGGITIDSQPEAELAETQLKAKALLDALNANDPWATW